MDGIPTPATRARRTKGASGRARGKSRKSGGAGRYVLARRVLAMCAAAVVFGAAFIVDTEAVARLLWACLAGRAGEPARLGAGAVVLLLLGVIALVAYRPAPAAKPRKRAARPAPRTEELAGAGDEVPRATPRAGKRGGRRGAQAATDSGT
jgi:hypothetical protein